MVFRCLGILLFKLLYICNAVYDLSIHPHPTLIYCYILKCFRKRYLLCISFWFKRDEPVVIIGKLTVDKLRQIISFEKCFNLLRKSGFDKKGEKRVGEKKWMDRRKHQFNVQNSGTLGKKDENHFQAYKTKLNFGTPAVVLPLSNHSTR